MQMFGSSQRFAAYHVTNQLTWQQHLSLTRPAEHATERVYIVLCRPAAARAVLSVVGAGREREEGRMNERKNERKKEKRKREKEREGEREKEREGEKLRGKEMEREKEREREGENEKERKKER